MRGWILAGTAVLGLVTAVSLYLLYQSAASSQITGSDQAKAYALAEGYLTEVERADYYYGRRAYTVLSGEDQNGEAAYVWIEQQAEANEDEEDDAENSAEDWEPRVVVRTQDEGISREEAEEIASRELEIQEWKQVRLGMIGDTPVYEMVYIDTDNRYSFYYLSFDDGSYIRHYQLRQDR
ncbi:hypothetical protein CR205_07275 [Alteribacter lacisalsi]|uniref:DUF5590 domain-containing protein n=1 Tax=Alteribacter lacisalsi TaxID=2045244 RepID=A0A2W0HB41_9BACI|nr:DUF5590 domain-containing protein [Alteribacter lacisalsi]PYZ98387.1 hypothetical protein CR205_07275 [Alteribacter lacisalsi]